MVYRLQLENTEYSNFQLFGIGKPSTKQSERRDKRHARQARWMEEIKHGGIEGVGMALLELTQRYNPAAAIPRAGVLGGIRVNIFGIAVRLYPAFLTPEEAKKKGIRVDAIAPAKKAYDKVARFWRQLGGDPAGLEKEIKRGYDKPVFKWTKGAKKRSGFSGGIESSLADDFSNLTGTEEAIIAGIGLLGSIVGLISSAGASKNPYVDKKIDTEAMEVDPQTAANEAELAKITQAAAQDLEAGKGLDKNNDGIPDLEQKFYKKPWFIASSILVGVSALTFGSYKLVQYLSKSK